jgi:hypothetical protein
MKSTSNDLNDYTESQHRFKKSNEDLLNVTDGTDQLTHSDDTVEGSKHLGSKYQGTACWNPPTEEHKASKLLSETMHSNKSTSSA